MTTSSHSNHNHTGSSVRRQKTEEVRVSVKPSAFLLDDTSAKMTPLTPAEMLGDLTKLLSYLKINLAEQREGTSTFLASYAQALVYAERLAMYAMQDYPRHVEGEPRITDMWDALYEIQRTVTAWRTSGSAADAQEPSRTIETIVQSALNKLYRGI